MKNVLCFGDSNTFGASSLQGDRYGRYERWTGLLQQMLGEDYYVIEGGLNGRTTVFDDPFDHTRNGLTSLPYVLNTHKPLDLIIIMLGTNDVKSHYSVTPKLIARGMEKLVTTIRGYEYGADCACNPEILIVSPILVGDVARCPYVAFDEAARERSIGLAPVYEALAQLHNCHFFNAASVAECGEDQLHMAPEGHLALATALKEEVLKIFQEFN